MNSIDYGHLLTLILQCIVVAALLLFLFRLRTIFGLSLLFTALGVFQYMQVFLSNSLYYEVAPGILVSPGTGVLFSGSLFMILLIYIREDALEARKVIYALLAANLVLSFMQIIISWGVNGEGVVNIYNLPKEFFTIQARVIIVGTVVLFLDSFIIIFLYESVSKYVSLLFLRIFFTMTLVLSFDTLLFSFGVFDVSNKFLGSLLSGLVSKISAAFLYSIMFTLYLIYIDKRVKSSNEHASSFKDIFYTLSYRQKFDQVYLEKNIQSQQFKKSEEQFRTIIEKARNVIYVLSNEGNLKSLNPAFEELSGWSTEEWIGKPFSQLVHPDDVHLAIQAIKEVLAGKIVEPYELRIHCKSGEYKIGEFSPSLLKKDNSPAEILGIAVDITDRRLLSIEIEDKSNLIETLFQTIPDLIWLKDTKGVYLKCNHSFEKLYGVAESDILGKTDYDFVDKELADFFRQNDQKAYTAEKPATNEEYLTFADNGYQGWFETTKSPMYNPKGEIIGVLGIARDITERKQTEIKLNESEEKFQTIFRTAPGSMILSSLPDGKTIEVNDNFYSITGYSRVEAIGKNTAELRMWAVTQERDRFLSILQSKGMVKDFEADLNHKSGAILNGLVSGQIFTVRERRYLISTFYDITERKKAEEEIRKMSLAVEQDTSIIIITDTEGKIEYVNRKFTETTGYVLEEIIGKTPAILKSGDKSKEEYKALWDTIKSGGIWKGEFLNKKKNGDFFNESASIFPLFGDKGEIINFVAVKEDITESKKAEVALKSSEDRFSKAFRSSPIGITITSQNTGKFIEVNQAWCNIYGFTAEEAIGHTPAELSIIGDYTRKQFIEEIKLKGTLNNVELVLRKKSGENLTVLFSSENIEIGGELCVLGTGIDVTEQKQTEIELTKYRDHLEEIVKERTIELEKKGAELQSNQAALLNLVDDLNLKSIELKTAMERAQAADLLKSAFLATMSHELRTPLNSIIGFTGILLKELAGPLNSEQTKQLQMAKGSAHHLLELINDVLDISKIEAGQLVVTLSPFNFRDSIQKVIASVQPLADKKGLELRSIISEDVIEINSDKRRVEQVFINLLNNAIKFTEKGVVAIECEIIENTIVTKVIDSGIGIDEKDLEKLFKPFSQVDTGLTRNHEGTGLGLSISMKLVEKLGGAIVVESKTGFGSTFIVTLPIERQTN